MNKKDNDILARDLVLAAFIVMKRQYESRDAGRAGKLQMFLNIHAGTHGDVKNIVAILNNPKSTAKLSDDQKLIYQRALDIVESFSEIETGWVEPHSIFKWPQGTEIELKVDDPSELGGIASVLMVSTDDIISDEDGLISIRAGAKIMQWPPPFETAIRALPDNILAKTTSESILSPEQITETEAMIEAAMMQEHPPTEQPKPKPGRKAKNPIETATTNAKKKGKACCN